LLVYIDNKFPVFIPSEDENLGKMPTSLREMETGWHQWFSFFGTSTYSWPVPVQMRPPEPDLPSLGDVINEWSLTEETATVI